MVLNPPAFPLRQYGRGSVWAQAPHGRVWSLTGFKGRRFHATCPSVSPQYVLAVRLSAVPRRRREEREWTLRMCGVGGSRIGFVSVSLGPAHSDACSEQDLSSLLSGVSQMLTTQQPFYTASARFQKILINIEEERATLRKVTSKCSDMLTNLHSEKSSFLYIPVLSSLFFGVYFLFFSGKHFLPRSLFFGLENFIPSFTQHEVSQISKEQGQRHTPTPTLFWDANVFFLFDYCMYVLGQDSLVAQCAPSILTPFHGPTQRCQACMASAFTSHKVKK